MYTVQHFINGQRDVGNNSQTLDIHNPATGNVTGKVLLANSLDIDQAIASAKIAFQGWSRVTPLRRARVLFKFKDLLEQHIDELAMLVTSEHGKVLADAKGSVMRGIELVEYACGIPALLKGSYSENVGTHIDSYTVRQPLGVCVGVTPFNFPVMVPIWMFVSAIACGNTFILKPSEKDPSAPLRLAELMIEAGLPEGVLNVIQGDKTAVEYLLQHPDIAAISCVGSTPVAEVIYKTGTANGKRAQAFGGAKNHCVVMPDADLDDVAEAVAGAAFGAAGERCMALSVVVAVGDAIADNVVTKLQSHIQNLKVGSGTEPNIDMGPLISEIHLQRVKHYVDIGIREGATLVNDGRNLKVIGAEKGFFMGPCLFDHVQKSMRIYQEEIFGPVLCIVRVSDYAAALQLVNDHVYGNGTAIFTRDGEVAHHFAANVQVGMVGINVPIPVPAAYHIFGGWKRSVFGDTHMHGDESIKFYTKAKTITQRWPKSKMSGYDMPTN